MFVGVARHVLQIPGSRSLKDRRRVVRSYKDRLRAKLPVSVAEVGDVERYQVATVGLAVVAHEAGFCEEILAQAARLGGSLHDALLADTATEIVSFGFGGKGLRGGIEQLMLDDKETDDLAPYGRDEPARRGSR
jgi:hypothetical protein